MDTQDRDGQLSQTRFAAELRRQLQTLADGAGARELRPRRRRLVIALSVGVAIAVILSGVALAAGGIQPLRDAFEPLRDTFWPTNERGQTYGSSALAKSPDDEPDLIAVSSYGKKGYCYKTDLDGPPPPRTPGSMSVDDLNFPGMRGFAIPKYESDGTTQIGVFWIGGGGGGGGIGIGGSRYEQCADANGTIITTEQDMPPDGPITITRQWLDGRKTTNSAEEDPSLSRLPAAERPTTWRDITLWFRDDGLTRHGGTSSPPVAPDWLAEQMSSAASAAGDPNATARWTLQYRRCAEPFEGEAAVANDEVKWSLVWIVILHGDFRTWPAGPSASPTPVSASPTSASPSASAAPASPASAGYQWLYLLLAKDSHEVIAEGASVEPFDTSMTRLQGRTHLGSL